MEGQLCTNAALLWLLSIMTVILLLSLSPNFNTFGPIIQLLHR